MTLVKGWRNLSQIKRTPDVDTVVLVDSFGRAGMLGVLLAAILRAPLVVRLRGDFFREWPERALTRSRLRWAYARTSLLLAKVCLERAQLIICNSAYLARETMPHVPGKAVTFVHNPYTLPGTDQAPEGGYSLPDTGFHLLTVTNMNLYSKVQPIFEALEDWISPEVWEDMDLHWVICGGGYYEERFRELVRDKGLQDRVRVLGQVKGISEMYEWCDVLVHLTRMESLGNVVMEAMMYGKPVITNADSCGTRELVFDGETGSVIDGADSFLSALRAYAEDPALRDQHGRAGGALVRENFSVDATRREMQRVLEEFVSANRRGKA